MNCKDSADVWRSRVWCWPRRYFLPIALLVVLALSSPAAGQDAIVHRRLTLRSQPTTTSASLGALDAGAAVSLVEPQPKKGFYHVRTTDGKEGWAPARSLDVEESDVKHTIHTASHRQTKIGEDVRRDAGPGPDRDVTRIRQFIPHRPAYVMRRQFLHPDSRL